MRISILLLLILTVASCNSNKEEKNKSDNKFLSVLSLIEAQVRHVDTSVYPILKVEYTDTSQMDSTYVRREDFRKVAHDFLTIPDLADPKVAKRYKEEPARYDELLERVILTYLPIDAENEEVKKQELLILPSEGAGDKVSTIMINREISTRDSFLRQDMIWRVDKSFQVTTTRQAVGKPEVTKIMRVVWNDDTP